MLDHARKADEIADDLMRRIVAGELAVGDLLPREADLAEHYGVNRSVVREALKLLEVHRLVEPRRRRGTEVLDPLGSVTPQVITAMLVPADRVDPEMLAELLEIRALLDSEMCGLAAERHTDAELAEIEACVEGITRGDAQAVEELGLAMARASHNRLFVMLSNWHRQITKQLAPRFGRVRSRAAEVNAYALLLDALRRRDRKLARSLTAQFHEWANHELIASVKGESSCSKK